MVLEILFYSFPTTRPPKYLIKLEQLRCLEFVNLFAAADTTNQFLFLHFVQNTGAPAGVYVSTFVSGSFTSPIQITLTSDLTSPNSGTGLALNAFTKYLLVTTTNRPGVTVLSVAGTSIINTFGYSPTSTGVILPTVTPSDSVAFSNVGGVATDATATTAATNIFISDNGGGLRQINIIASAN